MKKILFLFLLAVCSMSLSAQAPSKKCPVCGLSIPKCQYKGKHPDPKQQNKPIPVSKPTGYINNHGYVDLGLSVKWATCNIGASSPSEYGDVFAWGETSTKSEYLESNCSTYKDMGDISGNPQYDAACAIWGSTWRMPTKAEWKELVDMCSWKWTLKGAHYGCVFTSKKNGSSIFLPVKSRKDGDSYWSSTPHKDSSGGRDYFSYYFYVGPSDPFIPGGLARFYGSPIRPVTF